MRIHSLKGLGPGKCGKPRNIDICLPTLFTLVKQNCRFKSSIMFPVTGSDRIVDQKKVKGIVLKNFWQQSLTLTGEF